MEEKVSCFADDGLACVRSFDNSVPQNFFFYLYRGRWSTEAFKHQSKSAVCNIQHPAGRQRVPLRRRCG